MPGTDDEFAQINLRWCNKNVRSIFGVPLKSIKVALNGLKAFYNQINARKPNINHPDVFEFYKLSRENYPDLPELKPKDENNLNDDFDHASLRKILIKIVPAFNPQTEINDILHTSEN